ncbi:hypothetical protein ACJ72_04982 [Emergomyces africanus]|uniref:GH18 domain-containing protein n=1 Tax=Emergomyces africanus TaxID=1955775 RepID=A0A1B7NV78_9EURO|nr:hypothetical protein ACJ72_04982 [Emergomyces africanus]
MPPIPENDGASIRPRIICYYQTYYPNNGNIYVSMLPLILNNTGVTHVILAAIHINEDPGNLTLNDHSPEDPLYMPLWAEARVLQTQGIKVMGMLGGAARGSFERLDKDAASFERYYIPLRDMLRNHAIDGLDLDVEEEMSLKGIIRLIDRLKEDFGEQFIVTLAPVATALIDGLPHLSGFNYKALEAARGSKIAWYNAQFYNGWGSMENTDVYDQIIVGGWAPEKVVTGTLTNPENGSNGYVPMDKISAVLGMLLIKYPTFGGVTGWEYFNALPAGHHAPPLIFALLLVYLTSTFAIVTAPVLGQSQKRGGTTKDSRKDAIEAKESLSSSDGNGPGKATSSRAMASLAALSTGVPSSAAASYANLGTVVVNILFGLATLDFFVRGHYMYSTTDLAFSRVGYVSATTANILIREPDAAKLPIHISYRAMENGREGDLIQAGIIALLNNDTDYTYPVTLTGLQPSMEYRYSFSNNLSGQFTTAPAPGSAEANRITFLSSSCIKPNFPYNPFNHPFQIYGLELISKIVSKLPSFSRPSFMLFLGDFIYIDVPFRMGSSVSDYRSEYRKVYSSPSWHTGPKPAINIPWLHTLDDHEISNDWHLGNITDPYPAAFDPYYHYHMSVNPPIDKSSFSVPLNTTYFSFTHGPASFFMLDTRTYRTEPLRENSTMLGAAQLNSLLEFISRKEPAGVEWKIVTSSVPFAKNWRIGTEDTWGGFLNERHVIFEAIWRAERELGIRVVLLSGDRHEFGATRFPDPSLVAAGEGTRSLEDGRGIHEFCNGPLNMFYVPLDSYVQTDNEDILIKYLPAGNHKLGVINIDVENGRNSVFKYALYVEEELMWEYKLVKPLVWADGQRRVLPPGEVVYDKFGDRGMGGKMKKVLGDVEVLVKPLIKKAVRAVKLMVLALLALLKREVEG